MTIKNINVYNLYPAILGIRNAMKSKDKSDSEQLDLWAGNDLNTESYNHCIIGEKDQELIKKLLKGHLAHQERKFMRQILVSMDIKGSIKFWAQMDTFKIATVRNSESTMHSIIKGELTENDFEVYINQEQIDYINDLIITYNEFKNYSKEEWNDYIENTKLNYKDIEEDKDKVLKETFELIDANLPGGYLLESHYTCNYENLRNIYHSRKGHKMYFWKEFCQYIKKLPYFDLLIKD